MKERPYIIRNEALRGTVLQLIMGLDISKPWRVTVEPYRKKRSVEQNALYWVQLNALGQELGYSADDLHEVVKKKFLPPVFVEVDGEVHEVRRSTTGLNVAEMAEYMERFQAWAATDLGVLLPFPEDRDAA